MRWERFNNRIQKLYLYIKERKEKSVVFALVVSLLLSFGGKIGDKIGDKIINYFSSGEIVESKVEQSVIKKDETNEKLKVDEATELVVDKNLLSNIRYFWKIKEDIKVEQIKWVSVRSKDFYDMFIIYYVYGGDEPDESLLDKERVVDIFEYDKTERTGLRNLKHITNQEDFYNINVMENNGGVAFVVENLSSGNYQNGYIEIYEPEGTGAVLKYQSKYLNYSEFVIGKNEILVKGSGTKFKVIKVGKKYREINIPNTKLNELKSNEHLLVLKCNKKRNMEEYFYDNKKIEFKKINESDYISLIKIKLFYNEMVIYEKENCKSLRIRTLVDGDALDFMESFVDKILTVNSGSGELSIRIDDDRQYHIEFEVDKNSFVNSPEDM